MNRIDARPRIIRDPQAMNCSLDYHEWCWLQETIAASKRRHWFYCKYCLSMCERETPDLAAKEGK